MKLMIPRVENVLIIHGPDPIRHIFVIAEVSNNKGLPANSSWRFYITFICVGQRVALAVEVLGLV
jgi:hypothetical protein